MSDIKRYGVWDKPPREDLVTYADHEAAIALRTRVCAEAFEDELARTEERVLADAKARIEAERIESDGMDSWENGYHVGIEAALAALTQPQTEIEGKPDGTWYDIPDGGGAATAAGVADADLEGVEVHINGSSDLSPDEAKILGDAMKRAYVLMKERQGTTAIKPTPYAKAFRERVCPVPEFPSVEKGTHE